MTLVRWFSNRSIGFKIYLGFGLMVALATASLIWGLRGMQAAETALGDYREAAVETGAIAKVVLAVADVRLELRRFVHQPTQAASATVQSKVNVLDKAAETLAGELADQPALQAEALRIGALVGEFRGGFGKAVAAQTRFDGVLTGARAAATAMEGALERLVAAATDSQTAAIAAGGARSFSQARVAAVQFLNTPQANLENRTLNALDVLAGDLARLKERGQDDAWTDVVDDAEKALRAYRRNFTAGAAALRDRDTVIAEELQRHSQLVTDIADQISGQIAKRQDQTGVAAADTNRAAAVGMVAALIVMAGAGLTLAFGAGVTIARPAVRMTAAMADLAQGNLATQIPAIGRRDEIGRMAEAMTVFRDALIRNRETEREQRAESERRAERAEKIRRLTGDFDHAVSSVLGAVASAAEQLRGSAADMAGAAQKVGGQAAAVAAAAEEASVNVQTVAASTEQLTSSINEIGRQVESAASVAAQAVQAAAHTSGVVGALADSAKRIGQVVSVISDIAGQTNLLALNATIEAARAGDAGRGFAVVASEVKTLANQTARATEDVAHQVQEIQAATAQAVAAIDGIVAKVDHINHVQQSIAAAVEEQTAVTRDIARNTHAAASGAGHVSHAIDDVDDAARGAGVAAEQVLGASRSLADQSASLKQSVDGFLTAVRVA